jgi:hypothetical protein
MKEPVYLRDAIVGYVGIPLPIIRPGFRLILLLKT